MELTFGTLFCGILGVSWTAKTLIWRRRGIKNHVFTQVGFQSILGTILDSKMEIEGYETEVYEVEKTFCDKVFQDCDLMATDCVQGVMIQMS